MKYKLLKNLRKNGQVYKAGSEIEISKQDLDQLIERNYIKIDRSVKKIDKKKKKTTKKLEENGDIDSSNNNGKR
tara:strand:- start:3408 stop:3629 length:222 start_codon:yes stop_codon:yes gene_type:complete